MFSKEFKQTNTQHREGYKTIEGEGLFKNCQAHFGIWNAIGQDVSYPSIVVLCPDYHP